MTDGRANALLALAARCVSAPKLNARSVHDSDHNGIGQNHCRPLLKLIVKRYIWSNIIHTLKGVDKP